MYGIDISSWQNGLYLPDLQIDFAIAKATEGTGYVNPYCNGWIEQLTMMKKPSGVYHFASGGNPENEAQFFYDNCKGYVGKSIFVLDYEIQTSNAKDWCERFMQKFHDLTNIWPLLYVSASWLYLFKGSWLPDKCGLWLAGYPQTYTYWTNDDCPYDCTPWPFIAIWQFTSSLIIPGWFSKLDGNIAYMDENAWNKYAQLDTSKLQPTLSYKELASQIVKGMWGNDSEREKRLKDAGYDYETAQGMVNKYYALASECISGYWGNGWNRKNALESAGYDYDTVQMIVNELMR